MNEMITFADPGYNFLPIWIAVGVLILGIGLMIALYPAWGDAVAPIGIIPMLVLIFAPVVGSMSYAADVRSETKSSLEQMGFTEVDVVGDRFTAATEDGQYFRGVLVDMHPDTGYAYQVLELTELGELK